MKYILTVNEKYEDSFNDIESALEKQMSILVKDNDNGVPKGTDLKAEVFKVENQNYGLYMLHKNYNVLTENCLMRKDK